MDIRGKRRCTACGARWSYYETGEISCPECESLRSVGVDDRTTHTAGTETLDLTSVEAAVETESTRSLAELAATEAASYTKTAGFIDAGVLQPLSETYLGACELRRVGSTLATVLRIEENEELYLLELIKQANQGSRPHPDKVPETLYPERGLAATAAVDAYLTDLRRVLDDRGGDVSTVLSGITTRKKRIEALDGDVDPREAQTLVETTRDLGEYLRSDDETALARALERVKTEEL